MLQQAFLVSEDIIGPVVPDKAYLRIPWPEAQAWVGVANLDEEPVLYADDTPDVFLPELPYLNLISNK